MMRSAEDLLQELISLDESHRIEAKRCTQVDKSVMETVCAYSNEPGLGGGYLLLGVVRDEQDFFKNAYTVSGISNPDKIQSDLVSCRIPDDCIDSKRYPLFIARAVLKELIESLQSIQGVKPC